MALNSTQPGLRMPWKTWRATCGCPCPLVQGWPVGQRVPVRELQGVAVQVDRSKTRVESAWIYALETKV
jgi:hypothetical protein